MADIIPDPGTYQEQTALALKAYQNALSRISQRRGSTLQNYGMTAQVDPESGSLKNYGIDPNNVYGAIQSLMQKHGWNLYNARQNSGSRGLGLTGLGAQAADRARNQNLGELGQLGRSFVDEIGGESSDQLGASQSYNEARVQALRNAIAVAMQNNWFTPVSPIPPAPTPTTPNSSPPAAQAGPFTQATQFAQQLTKQSAGRRGGI